MNPSQIVDNAKNKFQTTFEHFEVEIKKIRTGRAHASMLDGVMVEVYGVQMPLNRVSTITVPEAQLLQITPFDPSNMQAISSAIRSNATLGLNPSDDGRIIRVPIPALSEDRRREYVKVLNNKVEQCLVTLRGIRHDAIDAIDKSKRDKAIGEDDAKRLEKQVDEAMNKTKTNVEIASKSKETEIMVV
jgi:ribosome recycling factor